MRGDVKTEDRHATPDGEFDDKWWAGGMNRERGGPNGVSQYTGTSRAGLIYMSIPYVST